MPRADIELIIFCATKHESVAACRVQTPPPRPVTVGGRRALRGILAGRPCLTVASGSGPEAADRMCRDVTSEVHPRLIVNFGAAGAVGRLSVGTLTVPREILAYSWPKLEQEGETLVRPVESLADLVPSVRLTRAGSCPHDIRDAAIRDRLRDTLHIETTDWETYRLALFCESRRIPFVALRCITDFCDAAAPVTYGRNVLQVLDAGAKLLESLVEAAWTTLVQPPPTLVEASATPLEPTATPPEPPPAP